MSIKLGLDTAKDETYKCFMGHKTLSVENLAVCIPCEN